MAVDRANSSDADVESFITRWQGVTASELSTSQSFLIGLCELLGVERPHPTPELDYMFERPLTFQHADGSTSAGRIDLYRRGAFVLESKKLKAGAHTRSFDEAMLRAHAQAQNYARALPASEGRPPFLVVVDVGHRIELYSEFSRSGGSYVPYPDPRHHRIELADLADPAIRERLRRVWLDPLSLDPSRESARVTRDIAAKLAELAKSLEHSGHAAESVAQFLMRCLFTMFAEDVRLLPPDSFRDLLDKHREQPDIAMRMLAQLWRDMDSGGFSVVLANDVLRFNGKLFKQPDTLPLDIAQIDLLIDAARADWKHVEPAIFGTLLERALNPKERHKLGAHYTPRAYVERLVLPTVIEPLRTEWSDAKAAALVQLAEAEQARETGQQSSGLKSNAERLRQYNIELRKARDIVLDFHRRLCAVRVLDPACGSGNFLYVTLEHLKRLEGEVLNTLEEFGLSTRGVVEQTGLDIDAERAISTEAQTVDPHNLLGIELNPRAAAIAEVVLWIGYLQWHFRTRGDVNPPVPVIRDFRNIENRDAVLAYDRVELVTDEHGVPVTRWDGETMKISPVTGEKVPDESARKPVEKYLNPRKAAWPEADFIVGNPPFIGNKRMRTALGDGYVEALRGAWPEVPESADFVMFWWHHAAQLTRRGAAERFGFITTNSIRQSFNRRVIEPHLADKKQPLSLVFAIPDHPWVDTADGAAVRIAMTVGLPAAQRSGLLQVSVSEESVSDGELAVKLDSRRGRINEDLTVGTNLSAAIRLLANRGLALRGITLVGAGFVVDRTQAEQFWAVSSPSIRHLVRPFFNGRDLTQTPREAFVVDLFGLSEEEARNKAPALYQWLLDRVKPEREQNAREIYRKRWWVFAEPRSEFREAVAGLPRYLVTPMTAKHRLFTFLDTIALPDQGLVPVLLQDAVGLGVLSSAVHGVWALHSGGTLEDRPRYNQSSCFETFPFPGFHSADKLSGSISAAPVNADGTTVETETLGDTPSDRIRNLAEQLDAHRKRQQAAHPGLTLTGMYNVLDKLRSGEALSAKERTIHEHGLVSVLRQLHDELDAAVLEAYGWSDLLPLLRVAHGNEAPSEGQGRDDAERAFDEAILERLVALNAERAAEEARGVVRWLRPEFQNPQAPLTPTLSPASGGEGAKAEIDETPAIAPASIKPIPWPKDTVDQIRAIADLLGASPAALTLDDIAARFSGRGPWKKRLPQLLDMLTALGRATEQDGRFSG
ncbi:DNA methyltransferase [Denitratimonas sp. CY0512]|uniref:class I SAM-dependent DNA methyltransferase n=1 Tax=Denitratimonas sp. CY0512 TaxID=3131940 RepID=UPI003098740D